MYAEYYRVGENRFRLNDSDRILQILFQYLCRWLQASRLGRFRFGISWRTPGTEVLSCFYI